MSKLCIIDKIYLGLVHLHLMYTNTLPVTATGNDGCIPVRITSKVSYIIMSDTHIYMYMCMYIIIHVHKERNLLLIVVACVCK